MEKVMLGRTGIEVTRIGLGGHEYLADGRSRGFNEDRDASLTPGHIFPDFGGGRRQSVLKTAYEFGINFFDVTQDSEKEALGRNLRANPPPYEIYIQTRPERMAYGYDRYNIKLTQLDLLRDEVRRILKLMRRDCLDFLNIPPLKWAFDHDPEYLDKVGHCVAALKKEGLIRFASADTFSGAEIYEKMIRSGHFDTIYINFNFGDHTPGDAVIPLARKLGLGVIAREAFMKGELFKMIRELEIDSVPVAAAAIRWLLARKNVDTVFYGTGKSNHLRDACVAAKTPFGPDDERRLDLVRDTGMFKKYEARRRDEFKGLVERMDLLFVPDDLRA